MYTLFPTPTSANEFGDMFGAVNSLFSGLALGGVIYAVLLQSDEIKTNQTHLAKSIRANEISARLMAYSTLLQECDNALLRYERWEKVSPNSDYKQVKAKVRESANAYRAEIEKLLNELKT